MIEGSFVALLESGSGSLEARTDFSQSEVRVDRVIGLAPLDPRPTTSVSSANTFRLDDIPVGLAEVTVTGPNHVTRRMLWDLREGTNTFEGVDLVNDPDFPMELFQYMFRRQENATRRWLAPAQIVVVSPNIDLSLIEIVVAELETVTRGEFTASVEARAPTVSENEALETGCDYRGSAVSGKIFVGQGPDDEAYFCILGGEIGPQRGPGQEIVWGRARVQNNLVSIRHQLGHAVGAKHPCNGHQGLMTIMGGFCGWYTLRPAGEWTPRDESLFLYNYSRPPGTRFPDDTRHLAPMAGALSSPGAAGAPASQEGEAPGSLGNDGLPRAQSTRPPPRVAAGAPRTKPM